MSRVGVDLTQCTIKPMVTMVHMVVSPLWRGPGNNLEGMLQAGVLFSILSRRQCMYVCMYLMIGKGQIAQKRPYWGENRLKSKIYG